MLRVTKRNGELENVSFDKVLNRITNLSDNLNVNYYDIAQKVCSRIYDQVKTSELDELAANLCSSMIINHPDYGVLAARIIISNHHKNTSPSFSETIYHLYHNKDYPLVTEELYNIVMQNKEKLNNYIKYERDFNLDYFGFKTLERSYLLKINNKIVERPQHLFMRVSLGIHGTDLKDALQTYDYMSQKYFVHATPTLFNSGTLCPQLSSCFLLSVSDSIESIYDSLKECAQISKLAGGIGIHIHDIRANGSKIRHTGVSNGIVPMLKVFNDTARYVNQEGKRNGSIAVYLEPHHADIFDFVDMKRPHGSEEMKARDLFYALWVSDLFMERIKNNQKWSLMTPDVSVGLSDVYGEDYKQLYEKYEQEGKYVRQVDAQELWFKILECQIESGVPYIGYKDAVNNKTNQKNLGTIKSSNLCVHPDTMIYTSNGYFPIKQLENKKIHVWNGKEFSETIVRKTGENQKLLTVKFNNGMEIKCTPYHKFYIEMSLKPHRKSEPLCIEARNLESGMKLIKYTIPTINTSNQELKYPYTHGYFCSNGHSNELTCDDTSLNISKIYLYGKSRALLKYFDYRFVYEYPKYTEVLLPEDIEKKFVPINYSINTKLRWLEGFFDGDGYVNRYNKSLKVSSNNKEFLTNVAYLLHTLGVTSKIIHFDSNTFVLNIYSTSLMHLINLGFSCNKVNNIIVPYINIHAYVKVESVTDDNEYSDTYCVNEPKEHKVVFNGILTGNCIEIVEYTSPEEIAVCNLASINLEKFVNNTNGENYFDFDKLHEVSMILTKNLNKIIDINHYPLEKARRSNLRHRPIGIGVQNLHGAYMKMKYSFDSPEAVQLNKFIFETIYHGALEQSMIIAKTRSQIIKNNNSIDMYNLKLNEYENLEEMKKNGYSGAYSSFFGSPAQQGLLQFDLWNTVPDSNRYNWEQLKTDIKTFGLRNSLLLALMPTASTSQILGSVSEAFEPITSNLYKRKTLSGEFIVINNHLVNDLISLGLWNEDIKNKIIINEGCISDILEIPEHIRNLYKTAFELSQKVLLDQAADRGKYICQTQSMNLFVENPDTKKLSSMHFYAWNKGLKTGIYYLRSKTKSRAQKFTIDPELQKFSNLKSENKPKRIFKCKDEEEGGVCTMCSS